MMEARILEDLSLGGVAAKTAPAELPKKYRPARPGERSTYRGAGIAPVTRLPNGEAALLFWQPQKGNKAGVRWYDFGGKKLSKDEFATACACRKFAKETYGLFGCGVTIVDPHPDNLSAHLEELYQGLCNLPLMLKSSQDWAQLQILTQSPKVFYNDVHEYHTYMLGVPYVSDEILNQVSKIVDDGKRNFRWLTKVDLETEVLAPRLHSTSFLSQTKALADDPWVYDKEVYDQVLFATHISSFHSAVA